MFGKLFDSNEKQLKKLREIVTTINSLEQSTSEFTDEQIKLKTEEWKNKFRSLQESEHASYLNSILPQAFALVREAAKRTLNERPHDVQLMAGIALHLGKIAEQKTGEGKTLTATSPAYLNSLTGKGVHIVTPNDYLSRHGAGWMGRVYSQLGISVGVIMQQRGFIYDPSFEGNEFQDEYAVHLKEVEKQKAYACDIVYGTNHEFGFDYLRDNRVYKFSDMVQTNNLMEWGVHNFAIIDEVDSILIDFARTPLIISTSDSEPSSRYHQASTIVGQLIKDSDYDIEEKHKTATLTDLGIRRVERMLGVSNLYEQDFEMVHLIEQSLAAHTLYEKDRDYVVKDNAVVIVDQFTGRLLPSNRYSHGLHQAIEAKENVTIQQESKTLAEISYQNYFRMYKKLSGMTGTAATEAEEFFKIYKLEVVVIPPNKPVTRIDFSDVVYKTEAAKYRAVADEVAEKHKIGQPVLIGTTSVEKSQLVNEQLKRRGVPHEILNAKNHEREAMIIAQAGKRGSVTVATNMAGRGVDIKLGGDHASKEEFEEIKKLGGLHVIGTERHDSRRIDNQLRGRSGRQGEPGSSRFFLSLQDDLMRIFGGEQVERLMDKFGLDENTPLEATLVSRSIESAQKKVEGFNFDRRKQVVEMDDVMNAHRDIVYKLRRKILEISEGNDASTEWFLNKLILIPGFNKETNWDKHLQKFGKDVWLQIVSGLSLPVIDLLWMDHLVDMDHVREGIGLRGYAQRDPIVEYKREGHERFGLLVQKMYQSVSDRLGKISDQATVGPSKVQDQNLNYDAGTYESGVRDEGKLKSNISVTPVISNKSTVGRNDLCPCGSGLKYKKCGMINAPQHKRA